MKNDARLDAIAFFYEVINTLAQLPHKFWIEFFITLYRTKKVIVIYHKAQRGDCFPFNFPLWQDSCHYLVFNQLGR